jgi:hypothetical protein
MFKEGDIVYWDLSFKSPLQLYMIMSMWNVYSPGPRRDVVVTIISLPYMNKIYEGVNSDYLRLAK